MRDSGRLIGEVLAAAVNFYNPSVIVIGGDVAHAHEQLLAGIREVVYQRSLPLATRHLRVVRSQLDDRAGVIGAAVMVIEHVLSPAAIDAAIAACRRERSPSPRARRPSGGCARVEPMNLRRLGDSDLEVSEISLGSWLTYSGGVEREQTEACTRAAFDAGINFFDTANVYGTGAAEEAWGEILSDYDRDSYILATKVYFPMSEADRGLSAEQIAKQIDASLRRLRTDYVDLYQCHRFDVETPIEETMEALTEVVESGKARYIGFSEWTPEQIRAGARGRRRGEVRLLAAAVQHDLARAGGRGLPALRRKRDLADRLVAARPGRAHRQVRAGRAAAAGDSRAASDEMSVVDRALHERRGARGGRSGCARSPTRRGLTMAQLALAWVLRRDELASAIIGASRPEQVHANVAASGWSSPTTSSRRSTRRSATSSTEPRWPASRAKASSTAERVQRPRAPADGRDRNRRGSSRAALGGQGEQGDGGEVRRGGGDHEHVEDLVVAEDGRAGVRPLGGVDDRPGDVEGAAARDQEPGDDPGLGDDRREADRADQPTAT